MSSIMKKTASVSTPRSDGKLTHRSPNTPPSSTRDTDRSSLSRSSSLSINSASSSSSLNSLKPSSHSQRTKSPIPPTPPNNTHPPDHSANAEGELQTLRMENKKLAQQKLALANKLVLLEEKVKNDQKKIQTLELVLQREASTPAPPSSSSPKSGRVADNKYLAEIDTLSSKLFKLEEKNQAMSEELNMLKSDLRNKRKENETKIRELQLKHDFDIRTLEQQQREFASGLKKETRKENDGLKQHLVVQETDLQKKHMRDLQDLRGEHLERELQLKEAIHILQDELEKYKQAAKRASIRRFELSLDGDLDYDNVVDAEDLSVEEPGFEDEDEDGDPSECY